MIKCKIDKIIDRSEYNITELCKYVGITRAAYYNILSSSADPKVSTASMILNFMNKHCPDRWPYTLSDFWEIVEEPEEKNDQIPGQQRIEWYYLYTEEQMVEMIGKALNLTFKKKDSEYIATWKGNKFTISKARYITDDQKPFISCEIIRKDKSGCGAPRDTIEEAIEYFRNYMNKAT